jgi:hypothetical protein
VVSATVILLDPLVAVCVIEDVAVASSRRVTATAPERAARLLGSYTTPCDSKPRRDGKERFISGVAESYWVDTAFWTAPEAGPGCHAGRVPSCWVGSISTRVQPSSDSRVWRRSATAVGSAAAVAQSAFPLDGVFVVGGGSRMETCRPGHSLSPVPRKGCRQY